MSTYQKFNWNNLLFVQEYNESLYKRKNDSRSIFKKDLDKICFSSSFRRLQDKAQVFPLENADFVRTRLTHSIEVMSVAESLGEGACETIRKKENDIENLQHIPTILRSAALIHDLGNPPFGHLSEGVIRKWFSDNLNKIYYSTVENKLFYDESSSHEHSDSLLNILGEKANDFLNYDSNAQTFRIINRLQTTSANNGSMKLSYPLLSTIIKYPINTKNGSFYTKNKKGVFYSDYDIYADIQEKLKLNFKRHPLVYLLEAADDISYLTVDIEDATKKGLIDIKDFILELDTFIKNKIVTCGGKNKDAIDSLKELEIDILSILKGKRISEDDKDQEINGILKLSKDDKYTLREDVLLAMHKIIIFIKGLLISQVKDTFNEKYEFIMEGKMNGTLLGSGKSKFIEKFLRQLLTKKVYFSDTIIKNKIIGQKIITKLLDVFIPAILRCSFDEALDENDYLCSRLFSDNFYNVFANTIGYDYRGKKGKVIKSKKEIADIIYYKILLVLDQISGMTDSYAKQIYEIIG